jgi:hypothetical protein
MSEAVDMKSAVESGKILRAKSSEELARAKAEDEQLIRMEAEEFAEKAKAEALKKAAEVDRAFAAAKVALVNARKSAADASLASVVAQRVLLPSHAWVVSKYDIPNMQQGNRRMEVGVPTYVEMDGWAHNQYEAGFFAIVEAPAKG